MTEQENASVWRLFWAIPLPDDVHEAIARLQGELARRVPRDSVRWTPPHNVHLTLVFLGNRPRDEVAELVARVKETLAGVPPFHMELEAIGVFPNWRRPRVVWLGVGGNLDGLSRAQAAVARAMTLMGWKPEKRPFTPHLTIGRVRKGLDNTTLARLGEVVRRVKVDPFGAHHVREIVLFRSDLRPTGAVYTPVGRVILNE